MSYLHHFTGTNSLVKSKRHSANAWSFSLLPNAVITVLIEKMTGKWLWQNSAFAAKLTALA
jgi:hypothetical protein